MSTVSVLHGLRAMLRRPFDASFVPRLVAVCLVASLLSPWSARAGGGLGEGPYEVGMKLYSRAHYATALKYFRKALGRNDVRAVYAMGLVSEATDKDADARDHFRRYVELAPPEDPLRETAARKLAAIEERAASRAARTAGLLEQGKSLLGKGRYREAEKILLKAAASAETSAEAHFQLGEVYLRLERYDKATAEFRKAQRSFR